MESFEMRPEDLEKYRDEGWAGPFELFDAEEMAVRSPKLIDIVERDDPSPLYGVKTKRDMHLYEEEFFAIFTRKEIVDRLRPLLGDDILLWKTNVFNKVPASEIAVSDGDDSQWIPVAGGQDKPISRLGWHQGANYLGFYPDEQGRRIAALYPLDDELRDVTCWFAVTDTTPDNGCIQFLQGSHKRGNIGLKNCGSDDPRKILPHVDVRLDIPIPCDGDIAEVSVKAGSFVLFSNYLVHASGENHSTRKRVAVAGRFAPNSVRIYPKLRDGKDPQGYRIDRFRCIQVSGRDAYEHNRIGGFGAF